MTEDDPISSIEALKARLAAGLPTVATERSLPPPDERSIVLVVGQGGDGVWRATISLPEWHELPAGWDGPHEMDVAIGLANGYAEAYGYYAIAIDIESSQLWQPEWGELTKPRDLNP